MSQVYHCLNLAHALNGTKAATEAVADVDAMDAEFREIFR